MGSLRLASALLLTALLLPSLAQANGAYTHVHVSQLARAALEPGEIATLLSAPENLTALEAGSMFPDSGYAVDDAYGELAHWEPFLSAYVAHLRARYGDDYSSPEAQRQIAFLLGVASHGMADQSYDTTLLARALTLDGGEAPAHPVDQYADYFLTIDEGISFTVEAWAPYDDLAGVILEASGGHEVSVDRLTTAMNRMSGVIALQGDPRLVRAMYRDAWESYPFLGTHVYNPDAVGSAPWLASLVVLYWDVLWRRLHGTDDADEDLVVRTLPEDGGVNWPVDGRAAWDRVAIWFGYGVDRDQLTPLVTMRDGAGALVPISFETAYNGRERNLLFLVPDADLAYDEDHTVEIAAGVETLDGRTSAAPFLFSFRTRCAPESLADCPALAPPLVTGPMPTPPDAGPRPDAGSVDAGPMDAGPMDAGTIEPPDGGGCSIARGARSIADPWIAMLFPFALLIARRRRSRHVASGLRWATLVSRF